ncbi:MAG: hypothetical protein AAB618_04140 [Patescibacteria group bacterium]
MSFIIMAKEELVRRLSERGVHTEFIDLHAIDAVSTCHYHTIKDDVVAGAYTFDFFIKAHCELEEDGKNYTIGVVRLLAQQTFHRQAGRMRREVERKINEGIVA